MNSTVGAEDMHLTLRCLAGLLLHCMHHMQEDADWQLAVAADFPGSRQWREQLPAVMKLLQLVPLLPSADMCKLLFWFEPVLVCLTICLSVCLSVSSSAWLSLFASELGVLVMTQACT